MSSRFFKVFLLISVLVASVSVSALADDVIHFWSRGYSDQVQDWLKENVFSEFERRHGVRVELQEIGWSAAANEKLLVGMASGAGPDLFVTGSGAVFGYAHEGLILPLDDYVAEWDGAQDFLPQTWVNQLYKGQVYGVPQFISPRPLIYHGILFEEVGLDPDAPPQNWADLLAAAQRLTIIGEDGGVERSGIELAWNDWERTTVGSEYAWFLLQTGEHYISEDLTQSLLNEPEALEALRFFKDLYNVGHPSGIPGFSMGSFPRGAVAIVRGTMSVLLDVRRANPFFEDQLRAFSPRYSLETDPVTITYVNGLAISSTASNPDLAFELIKMMSEFETMVQLSRLQFAIVPHADVHLERQYDEIADLAPWYQAMEYAQVYIAMGRGAQVSELVFSTLRDELAPENAIVEMHRLQQLGIDEWWE